MKRTSPSQATCAPWGLQCSATECHDGEVQLFINVLIWKGKSMAIVTAGIDLAKNVFAVHGVNETG